MKPSLSSENVGLPRGTTWTDTFNQALVLASTAFTLEGKILLIHQLARGDF